MTNCVYICGKCQCEANGTDDCPPPDWKTIKIQGQSERLICADCSTIHRFSASAEVETKSGATPIRMMGRPDSATSILLRSGVYLDLANPDCTIIQPVDIAAGLRQFRFSAQSPVAYTIAQHSCLVLELVRPIFEGCGGRRGADLLWAALMHDAPEAFLHDITRPLKGLLPEYRLFEHRFEALLFKAFGVSMDRTIRSIVKVADRQALAIEQRVLFGNADAWPVLKGIDRKKLEAVHIDRIWSPDEAEARFLETMHTLRPSDRRKAA